MLSCKELAEQASDYTDGNLGVFQRLNVKIHIMMCAHCQRFIQQLRITKELVAGKESTPPSDEVTDDIISRIPFS